MKKGKRGQLLILVIGVMAVGMFVIAPLLAYVDLSLRLSLSSHSKTSAFYAAEAGIEMAIGDLYMGHDIFDNQPYNGTMNGYDFSTTVGVPPMANITAPQDSEAYFDPGTSLAMRPMDANGDHEYPFVVLKGKDVMINWASFTSTADKYPHDDIPGTIERMDTTITLYDSDSHEVASSRTTADEQYAGNEGRLVANTLFVPGELIEGGAYTVKFENDASRDGSDTRACSHYFARDADQLWVFNGSITGDYCDDFISGNGTITLMVVNEDNNDGADERNTFSFFCDFVEVAITSVDGEGNESVRTYNYSGVDRSDSKNNSYTGAITTSPGTADEGIPGSSVYNSPPLYGGDYYQGDTADLHANYLEDLGPPQLASSVTNCSELTDEQYEYINASDGNRLMVPNPVNSSDKNACLWHMLEIDEDPADVTKIAVHWEGYQTKAPPVLSWGILWFTNPQLADDDELYLLMWNYEEDGGASATDGIDGKYHILERKQSDAGYTWVRISQGGYADYLITSTASKDGEEEVRITCYVRQVPGPSIWWERQAIDILSWNVHLHEE